MSDLSGAGALLNAVRVHLHGEVIRVIHERNLTNEEVQKIIGKRFDRHKRWKLAEGPEAIRWSPATFIDVATALGIPVAITVGGSPVTPRQRGKATSAHRPGSANASPALAA